MKRLIIILYFILFCNHSFCQKKIDSLKNLSYLELAKKAMEYKEKNIKEAITYTDIYLNKAIKSKDSTYIGKAYYLKLTLGLETYNDQEREKFLDSTIKYTLNSKDNFFPMLPLINRGAMYAKNKKFKKALDDYILTLKYAKENDIDYFYLAKYNIATLKRRTGAYNEAEKIYNECLKFYNYKEYSNDYLLCLIGLSNVYYESDKFEECHNTNKLGINHSLKVSDTISYYHFVVNEGINLSKQKKFRQAKDSILKSLPFIEDISNLSVAYFYLGKSLTNTNQEEEGLTYFKKVDSIFNVINDLVPTLRENYEYLIQHYKGNKNIEKQLLYTNQLLKLDSVLNSNYKYLNNNIIKRHDIPELLEEKKQLISILEKKNNSLNFGNIILIFSSILFFLLLLYFYRQKRVYKKRFKAIIEKGIKEELGNNDQVVTLESKKGLDIDNDIIDDILKNLKIFEQQEGFLIQQLSIQQLATQVETNSKYLSSIINTYKEVNFTTYINNLRVDYIIEKLKRDKIFRKYTIKAIADEGGFNSIDSFSRAFTKRTGLKPSYFIKNVNN